ncbi:MAG TPA: glycerophosphodiester phosphodiesterase [Casimicrobiaceae bacterium]
MTRKLAPWPYPKLAAHRGAGKLAPENTLASLRLGASHGYRMAEIDVKLSGDGVAFLLHDATLQRTTSGRGRADALAWRELALLDAGSWHSKAYAGEPLPPLAAVAAFCRAAGVALNIEIKPTPGRERETGAAVALDAQTLWSGAKVAPLLSSFSEASLDAAREAAPELARAYLADRLPKDWEERVAKVGCIAIDLDHKLLTKARVDAFHAAGLRIATWTVNEAGRARTLLQWGVDTVITDAVDVISPEALR